MSKICSGTIENEIESISDISLDESEQIKYIDLPNAEIESSNNTIVAEFVINDNNNN